MLPCWPQVCGYADRFKVCFFVISTYEVRLLGLLLHRLLLGWQHAHPNTPCPDP